MLDILDIPVIIYCFFAYISFFRYMMYLVISPFYTLQSSKIEKSFKRVSKKRIEEKIKVSVVISAWNEEVGIASTIKSLLKNSYRNMEIIVVNDGSTDNTNRVVRDLLKKLDKRKQFLSKKIVYISRRKNRGKGAGINTGIKRSTGNLIVTMDSDTKFEKDAIYQVARTFYNTDIQAAVGNAKVSNRNTLIGLIQRVEYTMGFYFKRTFSVMNSDYIIGGVFGIYRRSLFRKYGYFDEKNKTEDMEFSTKLKSKGIKTFFIEDAIAYTEGASDLQSLIKQRIRWRKGCLDVFRKYKGLFFSTKKEHNKFLSWVLLPISAINLIELFIFPFVLPFLIIQLAQTVSPVNMILWYVFYTITLSLIYNFGSKKNGLIDYFLIPFFFIFSYILIFVEIIALYKSLIMIFQNRDIVWQTWNRKGVENV